mmetsp:Transcript_30496/g.64800  ORF Transcript_30496/g.64800 Transcript_30496/m.64800 type:complete len:238 (+) Transcript_30496:1070-1783(+)
MRADGGALSEGRGDRLAEVLGRFGDTARAEHGPVREVLPVEVSDPPADAGGMPQQGHGGSGGCGCQCGEEDSEGGRRRVGVAGAPQPVRPEALRVHRATVRGAGRVRQGPTGQLQERGIHLLQVRPALVPPRDGRVRRRGRGGGRPSVPDARGAADLPEAALVARVGPVRSVQSGSGRNVTEWSLPSEMVYENKRGRKCGNRKMRWTQAAILLVKASGNTVTKQTAHINSLGKPRGS